MLDRILYRSYLEALVGNGTGGEWHSTVCSKGISAGLQSMFCSCSSAAHPLPPVDASSTLIDPLTFRFTESAQ